MLAVRAESETIADAVIFSFLGMIWSLALHLKNTKEIVKERFG